MNRFHYILAFAITIAVPCAYSQTWELGKDGAAKQTQTANTKGTKNQNAGDQASSKAATKTSISDDDLKQQVNQQFGTDAALRYILVEVQNGNVTLNGTVPSKADRKRAVRLAKLVPGVRKVRDSLTVDANASSSGDNEPTNARNLPAKPKTTAVARPHTRTATASTNRADASANRTAVDGGNSPATANANLASGETHLGSSVAGTAGGISGAAASASSAPKADPSGSNSGAVARNTGTSSADFAAIPVPMMRPLASTATLKGQIENALRNDSQVGSSNLNVNVTDTTIELSGSVPTGRERTAAYRIAQSFAFNRRVQDHLTVTGRNATGAVPDSNSSTPAGNGNSGKPAVGNSSTPKIPKSNATADGNAFRPPRL